MTSPRATDPIRDRLNEIEKDNIRAEIPSGWTQVMTDAFRSVLDLIDPQAEMAFRPYGGDGPTNRYFSERDIRRVIADALGVLPVEANR